MLFRSVVQRASRLAEKGELAMDILRVDQVVDPQLFERESEAELLRVVQRLTPLTEVHSQYGELASKLAESADTLNAFFDGPDSVMVMCDDLAKRNNRLGLLSVFRNQANTLADFNRLEG
mgnify:CR=1 FL=1